ncbi:oxidoreductase [Actinocatenispora comari]|uniref:oxidoreductase n=1 Tax=Actinocatenispora comari TaxID=2807577 RepID=UPI001A915057|nr:FAD-dependent oxidoreductase [Actinocatenispora comari]
MADRPAADPVGLRRVLSPVTLGGLALPHRVVMGSMHLGIEDRDDGGAALAAFYAARAAGGAGLIVTGGSAVNRVGTGGVHYSVVGEREHAPRLARVAEAVHETGGLIALQLFHAGRYAFAASFGLRPVAPSAVPSRFSPDPPRALTGAEIAATIDDFARGAATARRLGFDAVELMGSEGYLLNQFTSAVTNRRDDGWGGDAARRRAFPLAVLAAVRDAAGADFPVLYRMSGADLMDGAPDTDEVLALARELARAGAAALNVGIGWHESRVPTVQAVVPPGTWAPYPARIRAAVAGAVPVIASNRINRLAQAEQLLAAGDADLVSLARPFLADPELIARSRAARPVNVCIGCNQACIDRSLADEPVSCMVNPAAGRELSLLPAAGFADPGAAVADATRAGGGERGRDRRRYAVVGAGPAGLAAAHALATAGERVVLYEAADEPGGQFRLARLVPGKADYGATIEYYAAELAALGVELRLAHPVGPDDRAELAGCAGIVLATGVLPRPVDLPGADGPNVLTYPQAFAAADRLGERVVVVGGGGIAVDLAHLLSHGRTDGDERNRFRAEHGLAAPLGVTGGRQVTLLRRGPRIGTGIGRTTRWALLAALRRRGVLLRTGVRYDRITPAGVLLAGADGPELVPADTVVVAAGQLPADALRPMIAELAVPYRVVGGAADGAVDAVTAFAAGAEAGRALRHESAPAPTP